MSTFSTTRTPHHVLHSTVCPTCRYCYYNETQNILGNTYGMAVLQDFEALTPNLLARTVETVEGGGLVVLLLSNLNSLSQLYSLTMDVHSRLRTESHQVLSNVTCPMHLWMCSWGPGVQGSGSVAGWHTPWFMHLWL